MIFHSTPWRDVATKASKFYGRPSAVWKVIYTWYYTLMRR